MCVYFVLGYNTIHGNINFVCAVVVGCLKRFKSVYVLWNSLRKSL